jgi:hypothetical protein
MNDRSVMIAGQPFDHMGTSRMALPRSKVNVAIPDMDGRAGWFGVSIILRKDGRSRVWRSPG